MKIQNKVIRSWKAVFQQNATIITVDTLEELKAQMPCKVAGAFHSYNRAALGDKVVLLGKDFKTIKMRGANHVYVGAAVKVEELLKYLLDKHKCLINKGNYDGQTLVGAAVTGTHGFGPKATIMDSIVDIEWIDNCITGVVLEVSELMAFKVHQRSLQLSEVTQSQFSVGRRAYAVLPYSNDKDPLCISAEYINIPVDVLVHSHEGQSLPVRVYRHFFPARTKPPLHLRIWWRLDQCAPFIRKFLQKLVYRYRFDKRYETDPHDFDALYDPLPGIAGRNTYRFAMWDYRPTYTCYNISLFVKPKDTEEFIKDAILIGENLKPNIFRCMIGVRELTDKSDYKFAGNYDGPRNAVDFYCTPRKAKYLIMMQRILQAKFDLRLHQGKAVLNTDGIIETGTLPGMRVNFQVS